MASTELTPWEQRLATLADEYAGTEQGGGEFLSTRGGILTYGDDALPGNQMAVVILDVVRERTYYTQKYDASSERNNPPVCYAFGRSDAEMAPHPSMQVDLNYFQPQADECASCPMNEWGTSDTGRGKACGERRRMAVLPAGLYTPRRGSRDFDLNLFTDPAEYEQGEIVYMKLPVMSVKDWARYVTQLSSQLRRPPFGVVTRVYLEPDPKAQFRVKFEMIEELPNELFEIIMARHEEAKAGIVFGYAPPSEAPAADAPRRHSVRR